MPHRIHAFPGTDKSPSRSHSASERPDPLVFSSPVRILDHLHKALFDAVWPNNFLTVRSHLTTAIDDDDDNNQLVRLAMVYPGG